MGTVIALIVAGAVLLMLETILPGLVAGIIGAICLLAGIIAGYTNYGAATGTWILLGVGIGLLAVLGAYVKMFPTSRIARRFVSQRSIGEVGAERPELLHRTGVAHSQLRPSGTALINGQRVDVVTEGALIERGTPIKVVATEGLRVVVRPI